MRHILLIATIRDNSKHFFCCTLDNKFILLRLVLPLFCRQAQKQLAISRKKENDFFRSTANQINFVWERKGDERKMIKTLIDCVVQYWFWSPLIFAQNAKTHMQSMDATIRLLMINIKSVFAMEYDWNLLSAHVGIQSSSSSKCRHIIHTIFVRPLVCHKKIFSCLGSSIFLHLLFCFALDFCSLSIDERENKYRKAITTLMFLGISRRALRSTKQTNRKERRIKNDGKYSIIPMNGMCQRLRSVATEKKKLRDFH